MHTVAGIHQKEEGIALILVLALIAVVTLIVAGAADLVEVETRFVSYAQEATEAFYLADAGVEWGIFQLKKDMEWTGTGGPVPFPEGAESTFEVSVLGESCTRPQPEDGGKCFVLSSTGRAGVVRTVRAEVWIKYKKKKAKDKPDEAEKVRILLWREE
ncbi:MAG: pilus assembly PilX N-terminal domain-containing protein [Armatimonadota bacterium]|nr:pilus assembly PilX N-terminal domain-containing protein [Armatimonadota bacterium]